jgi:hypothetical protein
MASHTALFPVSFRSRWILCASRILHSELQYLAAACRRTIAPPHRTQNLSIVIYPAEALADAVDVLRAPQLVARR